MSSFDALESSVEGSRPIELYEFSLGNDTYRFTSAEDTLTPVSDPFAPLAIARTRIEQGSDQNNRNIIVTMPASQALAQLYVDVPPPDKLNLSIFRYQRDESPAFDTQVLMFKGVVQSVRFPGSGRTAEMTVRSFEVALNRIVPRFTFMGMCNHILGDDRCGATASTYTGTCTAVSSDGQTLTIGGLSAGLPISSTGGFCHISSTNDFRMVLEQSGDDVSILVPMQNSPLGQQVTVSSGCDHVVTSGCVTYDNIERFGGFAWVPSKNIFTTQIL